MILKSGIQGQAVRGWVHVQMRNAETLNPEQISEYLKLGEAISFTGQSRAEKYAWAQRLLVAREYACQGKKERGRKGRKPKLERAQSEPERTTLIWVSYLPVQYHPALE